MPSKTLGANLPEVLVIGQNQILSQSSCRLWLWVLSHRPVSTSGSSQQDHVKEATYEFSSDVEDDDEGLKKLFLCAGMVQYMEICQCNPPYKHTEGKETIISLHAEKAFDKNPFTIKVLERSGLQGTCLNIIKAIYIGPIANIKLNGQKLKPVPLN